jgi:hypothetical protein
MDADSDVFVVRGFDPSPAAMGANADTNWQDLYQRGLLRDGNYIEFLDGSGKYAISTRLLNSAGPAPDGGNQVRLLLQTKYRLPAETPPGSVLAFNRRIRYRLYLTPAPLPNQEPTLLPKGVVIHLDRCSTDPDGRFPLPPGTTPTRDRRLRGNRLPPSWRVSPPLAPASSTDPNSTGFSYTPYCDLMFSPRGTVDGPEASVGLIHLYVGEQKDADRDRADWSLAPPAAGQNWSAPEMLPGTTASDPTGNAYQRGDKLIVSIFTRTGRVMTSPIFTLPDGQEVQGQRFRYSETGEVAGK